MRTRKQKTEPENEVPAWIVSFSDMVTLLLAFFVLLQSFASTKNAVMFRAGTGSFKRSVLNFGLPDMLVGKNSEEKTDWKSIKYPMAEETKDCNTQSIKDADDEKIRELFDQIRKLSDNVEVENPGLKIRNTWPTAIKFSGRNSSISSADRDELALLADRLKRYVKSDKIIIYVVGFAPDTKGLTQQMMLSARRARSVEKHLRSVLAQQLHSKWRIRSLGTSENNRWSSRFSADVNDQYIAIAIIAE